VVLKRAVLATALAGSTTACGSAPPSPSTDPETAVVARWAADDGSVVAMNIVLGQDADRRRLPALARAFRIQHPTARVIVTFFRSDAGKERFVIGHIPTDGGPLTGARPSSALATFDYPRPSLTPTAGAP
jgi:hypothetical protein